MCMVNQKSTEESDLKNNENKTEPIRVLHCVAGLNRGGYETFIMNVYRKIDRTKVQFDFLYSIDGVFNQEIQALGGRLYKIPFVTQAGTFIYKKNVIKFFKNHQEYTIIHSHMDKFSGMIMACAKQCNIPVRIAHSHNTKNEGGFFYHLVKNYYGEKINKNCTDRFACSEPAAKWLFGHENVSPIVIKNSIDTQVFTSQDNRKKDMFTVVNIARFSKQKNHTFLIDIFIQVYTMDSTARLFLAGTGALQQEIKTKVEKLGLTQAVCFLDDCKDIAGLLAIADVVCMPSLFEGLPVSLIEAQSSGTPCVISDTIPSEVDVTGDVQFLSLQDSAAIWAKNLLELKGKPKKDNQQKIIDHGYDIHTTVNFLTEFYLSKNPTTMEI